MSIFSWLQAVVLSTVSLTSLKKLKYRRGASVTLVLKSGESAEYFIPQARATYNLPTRVFVFWVFFNSADPYATHDSVLLYFALIFLQFETSNFLRCDFIDGCAITLKQ